MRSALSPPHTVCRGQALCLLLRGRLQGPKNATVALTTKPQGSLANAAKALTLKYSLASGPSLTHEIEPMNGKVGGLAHTSTRGCGCRSSHACMHVGSVRPQEVVWWEGPCRCATRACSQQV